MSSRVMGPAVRPSDFVRHASAAVRFLNRPGLLVALILVVFLVERIRLMRSAATGPIALSIVQRDAAVFALIFLLYAAAALLARVQAASRPARLALSAIAVSCRCVGLLLAVFYVVDVFVYYFFVTRFYVADLVTFSHETQAGFTLARTGLRAGRHPVFKAIGLVSLGLVALYACYRLLLRPSARSGQVRWLASAGGLLLLFSLLPLHPRLESFGDKPLYENFLQRNQEFFRRTSFTPDFRARVLAQPQPLLVAPGRARRLNVVLLLVESLSAYDSRYFSGVEDWTPHLDAIARRETAIPDFYANGWTTIGGVTSLLGRVYPIVPEHAAANAFGSARFDDYRDTPNALPRALRDQGYFTEFFAAGDLGFLGQDRWLRSVGFQKLVAENDPRFAAQTVRGPFNSVPDRVLFDQAAREIAAMPSANPYFLVVQTFWSHRPFMDPNGGQLNAEEPVIRETDAQIGAFYQRLLDTGFFDNGVLFIVGDHRAAEPFHREEFARFGLSVTARIPAVVVTHALSLPHVIPGSFQQRDFIPSVESLVQPTYTRTPFEGSFLADPAVPPRCILHARGDDRDLIYVRCGAQEGIVRVDGDHTRFLSGSVSNADEVLQTINRSRVRP